MTERDFNRLFAELNARQMRRDERRSALQWLLIVALAFSAAAMIAVEVTG